MNLETISEPAHPEFVEDVFSDANGVGEASWSPKRTKQLLKETTELGKFDFLSARNKSLQCQRFIHCIDRIFIERHLEFTKYIWRHRRYF